MQELRFVAVSEDGSYAVLAVPGRSGRYVLPIDERLRAIANGQTSRLAQYEIEVESPLRPKEIQARIRAGETAEEIADAAGIPVERVRWFEGPVLAERAYIAEQAQAGSVRRAGDSGPGPRLGDIVPARLSASGADPDDAQWDSRKRGDGSWQVTLSFPSAGRVHIAEWIFDPRRRHVMPDDDNAARLSLPESELPPEPVAQPGEATVTALAPRLGAAAGMGGGGVGGSVGGGFASGGPGIGVRSFRPERSVIPDRSLGTDRTLAAERGTIVPRASQDHTAHQSQPSHAVHQDHTARAGHSGNDSRQVTPEPAPYFTPDPAVHRAAAPAPYRAPEPAPARTPEPVPTHAPEPPQYRAPEPVIRREPEPAAEPELVQERPAMPRPIMSRDPEPTVLLSPPAPTAPAEQLEPTLAADSNPVPPAAGTRPRPAEPQTQAAPPAPAPPAPTLASAPAPVPPAPAPASSSAPPAEAAEAGVAPAPASAASRPTSATVAAQQPTGRRPMPAVQAERTVPAASEPVATPEPVAAPVRSAAPQAEPVTPQAPATPVTPAAGAAGAAVPEVPVEPGTAMPAASVPEPAPASEPTKPQGDAAAERGADDQSGRARSSSKRNAKGRRSSVPSWDEIMLGSSRQRD